MKEFWPWCVALHTQNICHVPIEHRADHGVCVFYTSSAKHAFLILDALLSLHWWFIVKCDAIVCRVNILKLVSEGMRCPKRLLLVWHLTSCSSQYTAMVACALQSCFLVCFVTIVCALAIVDKIAGARKKMIFTIEMTSMDDVKMKYGTSYTITCRRLSGKLRCPAVR